MKLIGSYKLNVKKEVVWRALNDANILKKCIPGCDTFEKNNDESFTVTSTNQIGPLNATFSGTIKLSNINENESYTLTGEGQSSVGFANGIANVKIKEIDGTTTLSYEVNLNVGGKIAQLGSRLIDGVSKKMSDYFFGHFADLVAPITIEEKLTGKVTKEKRVAIIKSNFLNKYVYSIFAIIILLLVVIFYFVSR